MNQTLHAEIGIRLVESLGLQMPRREGHNLAGACIFCKSSDAFRVHQQTGVGYCHSCQAKPSPFHIAEKIFGDRQRAIDLMVQFGVFESRHSRQVPADPIGAIATQKGITPASLRAYGAHAVTPRMIKLPAFGPDGSPCTAFAMHTGEGKGVFASGLPAGLFFPHLNGSVQLPSSGQTWHLVEGPKDAAALHGLGLLACGLNTNRLAAKFARLFRSINVVIVHDLDHAGETGARYSAAVLQGLAASVKIARLPGEFRETKGDDVRDVLRRPGGRELVLQAIADATAAAAIAEIADEVLHSLTDGKSIKLVSMPTDRRSHRLIVATIEGSECRDLVNLDSGLSRDKFTQRLCRRFRFSIDIIGDIDASFAKLSRGEEEEEPEENSPGWQRLLEMAPGLRGLPAGGKAQRETMRALAACLADPNRREILRALILDLLADDLSYLLKAMRS